MMSPLVIDFARPGGPTTAGMLLVIVAAVLSLLAGNALWHAYRGNDRARAELASIASSVPAGKRVDKPEPTALEKGWPRRAAPCCPH